MAMKRGTTSRPYFPHVIQISARHWHTLDLGKLSRLIADRGIPHIIFYRQLALKINGTHQIGASPVHAGQLNLFATLQSVFRYLIDVLAEEQAPDVLLDAIRRSGIDPADNTVSGTIGCFVKLFPPEEVLTGTVETDKWLGSDETSASRKRIVLRELLLLRLAAENPAIDSFREILDEKELARTDSNYQRLMSGMTTALSSGPLLPKFDMTLFEALLAPIKASPDSLSGQVGFLREQWIDLLPPKLLEEVVTAFDILLEEERERGWGGEPGPAPVLEFGPGRGAGAAGGHAGDGSSVFGGYDYPEYEHFSADADWMSHVVLLAKMVYVWLDQLSKHYGYPITRLDQVPDRELDRLALAGFTGLWLIGIWERSPASQRIKQLCGNPDAIASAYSLYDYEISADLGGWEALGNLRERALLRGIRLASDMVPNHTGIYSRWVIQHPDWFIQTDYPPFPTYRFNGENLSHSEDAVIQIEDGYWTKSDAAVVFRYIDRNSGHTRYIYHGNDGTSIPWNDTAQLNYLLPDVREAVIQTILHVARNFPIIRFDAAMTLAKKHYQRLWFPVRGLGGGIPSRAEHGMSREEFDAVFPVEFWREVVDRVAAEAPGTLLLAEAFWMMEGYFVRTLGMHRVYNSAFMNMLKQEENAKYRQTIKNVLEFNPQVLKRFVNFMNNPDEKTAVEQFGTQGKYFGACLLMVTMPGLPMFGHGQIEGLYEKYGMEYKRAYWDESADAGLVRGHEMWIFPLLRRRWLFSGSENFTLYDFYAGSNVNENVFAYSNHVGEQRALVLYHNSYATTAGWVNGSVSFAVKSGTGESELRSTTLGRALGMTVASDIFYIFRDSISGLEFLRNSLELCEKGLYAELGEYEFHVFLDFKEIKDDNDRSWGNLCDSLNGRGVKNIEDERRQVLYAPLNAAFSAVMKQTPALCGTTPAGFIAAAPGFIPAVRQFLSLLAARDSAGNAKVKAKKAEASFHAEAMLISEKLASLAALVCLKPATKDVEDFQDVLRTRLDAFIGVRILTAWLLLHNTVHDLLKSLGFDYSLRQILDPGDLPDSSAKAHDSVQLLRALLAIESASGLAIAQSDSGALEKAFANPACREYLLVHESEGVEWFNKERFEDLTQWIFIIGLTEISEKQMPASMLSARLKAAGQNIQRITDLAALTGYRTALYLSLSASEPMGAAAKKQTPASPKATKEKADVQSCTGAHTTGTPDK